jgi:hypothetical protein
MAMASGDVCDRERLVERLNQAVRRPAEFGGLPGVARLLDRLAASDPPGGEQVWIPDTNARLAPSTLMRDGFPSRDIHVVASQYGEDAHRRGWLRLDRTLTPAELSVLVDGAAAWSRDDRSLHEIVAEFGPASVTFGSTDPIHPKTLSYATDDPTAPVVAFHLGAARTEPRAGSGEPDSAVLLAVRIHDGFFGGWELTPCGEDMFASGSAAGTAEAPTS